MTVREFLDWVEVLDCVEVGRPKLTVDGIIPCRVLDSLLLLSDWIRCACLTFLLLCLPCCNGLQPQMCTEIDFSSLRLLLLGILLQQCGVFRETDSIFRGWRLAEVCCWLWPRARIVSKLSILVIKETWWLKGQPPNQAPLCFLTGAPESSQGRSFNTVRTDPKLEACKAPRAITERVRWVSVVRVGIMGTEQKLLH